MEKKFFKIVEKIHSKKSSDFLGSFLGIDKNHDKIPQRKLGHIFPDCKKKNLKRTR